MQAEIAQKDTEISKLREKSSIKVKHDLDNELRRAKDVLKHLKKKVGTNAFDEEYKMIINEIKAALGEAEKPDKPEEEHTQIKEEVNPKTDPKSSVVVPFLFEFATGDLLSSLSMLDRAN